MALFREMVEAQVKEGEAKARADWKEFFSDKFGKECMIPDKLCIACWNCSLFGGMEAGKGATFSRIRYFDSFSVEDAAECVQTDDSPEQMAIGNTVSEDLSEERGEASFHRYEYVKAGTRFPFITLIESPTLLDVAGYLAAVKLADQHGYGKYSASHGKFDTEFLAVSTGYPLFSVLDMLPWLERGDLKPSDNLRFEAAIGEPVSLFDAEITEIQSKLADAFQAYVDALKPQSQPDAAPEAKSRKRK
jgi:CRISPR type I-D-associated protein Csc2